MSKKSKLDRACKVLAHYDCPFTSSTTDKRLLWRFCSKDKDECSHWEKSDKMANCWATYFKIKDKGAFHLRKRPIVNKPGKNGQPPRPYLCRECAREPKVTEHKNEQAIKYQVSCSHCRRYTWGATKKEAIVNWNDSNSNRLLLDLTNQEIA